MRLTRTLGQLVGMRLLATVVATPWRGMRGAAEISMASALIAAIVVGAFSTGGSRRLGLAIDAGTLVFLATVALPAGRVFTRSDAAWLAVATLAVVVQRTARAMIEREARDHDWIESSPGLGPGMVLALVGGSVALALHGLGVDSARVTPLLVAFHGATFAIVMVALRQIDARWGRPRTAAIARALTWCAALAALTACSLRVSEAVARGREARSHRNVLALGQRFERDPVALRASWPVMPRYLSLTDAWGFPLCISTIDARLEIRSTGAFGELDPSEEVGDIGFFEDDLLMAVTRAKGAEYLRYWFRASPQWRHGRFHVPRSCECPREPPPP